MHTFKRSSLFHFFLFALLFLSGIAGAEPRMTGVRDMTPEEEALIRPKMFRITEPRRLTKAPLPPSVKNIAHLPVVTSQGQLGSCAAYATCYYMKTHQEARENGWINPDPLTHPERIASPAWGYNIVSRSPGFGGSLAVSHYVVADYICEFGIASWEEMPYDPFYETYDWDDWPTEAEWKRGIEWRGQQAGVIVIHSPQGIEALKEHLAGGDLAVITTPVYSNFDAYPANNPENYTDNGVLYGNTDTGYRGGHALTVVGYDDNREYYDDVEGKTKYGAFLLVNSWGPGWGVNEPAMNPDPNSRGFIWIAYDFFMSGKNGDPDALVIIDRINYRPELFAIVGVDHTRGRKLLIDICAGEKNVSEYPVAGYQWKRPAMPVSNDYPLEDSRIVTDLTDYMHYENLAFHLEVFHLLLFAGTGDITYFAVQKGDNQPVVSTDAPKSPEINWYSFLKTGFFPDAGELFGGLRTRRGGIAWADFNKDGLPDLLITGFDWKTGSAELSTLLFINKGDGTFEGGVTGGLPQLANGVLAVADFDNDGYPDVAIYGEVTGDPWQALTGIYRNNGDNTFSDTGVILSHEEVNSLSWADYDNDGRPDLAVSAGSQMADVAGQTIFYRNGGVGAFAPVAQPIEASGEVAWADYDNDGRVDFIIAGRQKTSIYRNAGDGIFTEAVINFPALRQAAAAWGDYDGDGYIDLALSGRLENSSPHAAVYKNNGGGTFTVVETPLANLLAGSLAWGDINNDGLPDLVATGRTEDEFSTRYYGNYPNRSTVYLNDGTGSFFNAFAELPGVSEADFIPVQAYNNTLGLIDYDTDGDLDIFLSGTKTYMYTGEPEDISTGIQKSLFADEELDNPNSLPQAPAALFSSPGWEDGAVVLEWSAGSDEETAENGLYYNVRVGSSPGGIDIVNPVNALVTPGAIPRQAKKLLLAGLPAGTYYWAVQSMDSGKAVSPWSAESSFVVDAYTRTYNLHIDSGQPALGTTGPLPGTHTYDSGTEVQVTAVPYGGYAFSHWSGDIETPLQNPANVVMDKPRSVTAHFVLAYNISPEWEEETSSASWEERLDHSTVVFDGRIWVLGGNASSGRKNDVWYSTDGISWMQATDAAGWTKRFGHVSLVFNNRIWVLGGYDATGYLNDVWSSADGVNWTPEANPAPWGKRCYLSALVFDGKMWVIGGKGSGTRYNDVWSSADGINWTQAADSCPWTAREGHAAAVFDGKMWVIGGYTGPLQYASDVWYSTDGISWTAATQSASWAPRQFHTALALDGKLWFMGGIARDSSGNWIDSCSEVWYSYDGVNWSLCSYDDGLWTGRYGHSSAVFNGRLWVLGGNDGQVRNDAWSALPASIVPGTLVLTLSAEEGGTTVPPAGYYYDTPGKVFSLQAVPSYGYRFNGWAGDVGSPGSENTTVTLDSDKTVTANFEKLATFTLDIAAEPSGGGTLSPSAGTYAYPEGTVVSINAVPEYRFAFSHWTGDVDDPGSSNTSLVMDGNKSVEANFMADPFAAVVNIAGGEGHTVFLQDEGTVWTWGLNSSGQLGDGTDASSDTPLAYSVFEPAKAVSAGIAHTAALRTTGTVWAWGSNAYGQLGINSYDSPRRSPVQVSGLTNVIEISCGGYHTAALKNDGTVWTWGRNDSYQLGIAFSYATHSKIIPSQVYGPFGTGYLDMVEGISAGYAHNLAVRQDGSVWAWGDNSWGQLGTGNRTVSSVPVQAADISGVKAVSAGGAGITGSHSLAVKDDGSVWSWGANGKGQLGDGSTEDRLIPVQVRDSAGTGYLADIRQVAAGGRHSLALDSEGNVWAWGSNNYGQLGDGTNDDRLCPVEVAVVSDVRMIAAGMRHSIAVDSDGRVWVWGHNINGQLGDGTAVNTSTPLMLAGLDIDAVSRILTVSVNPPGSGTTVPSGARKYRENTEAVIEAAAGARYRFDSWGGDAAGSETSVEVLMNGDKDVTANFELIPGLDCRLTMVCSPAGAGFLAPVEGLHEFEVGTVVNILAVPGYRYRFTGWSENVANPSAAETSVALEGDTTVTAYFEKTPFEATPAISAGGMHALVLKEDSSVWASGDNTYGQLGINSSTGNSGSWSLQAKGLNGLGYLSGAIGVSGGFSHSTALAYDGTVYSWGRNMEGQLGDGTTDERAVPVKVKSPDGTGELAGIIAVSASRYNTAAVKMDGTVWVWGRNNFGQLGNNSTGDSNLPVQVHGEMDRGFLEDAVSVASGPEHTLALLEDGTVWAWGKNNYGQLGDGNSGEGSFSSTPVKVLNLEDIVAVAANNYQYYDFSLALKDDGTVWAWGGGREGQLGNGTSGEGVFSAVPLMVPGLTDVRAIAAGRWHVLALKNDGTVWAWGDNYHGQVGDNTSQDIKTTPVQVKGLDGVGYLSDVIAISAGYRYSMALKGDGTVWFWGYNESYVFGDPLYPDFAIGQHSPVERRYTQLDTSVEMAYLSMSVIPEGAGTTVPIESIHAYNPGSVVNVRAAANEGYVFSRWSEGSSPYLEDSTVTVDASKIVTAFFEKLYPDIGDINKDGFINIQDVILALRMSVGLPVTIGFETKNYPYPQERIAVADANTDGMVNIADAILVLRLALGLSIGPPDPYEPRPVVGPDTEPESVAVEVAAGEEGFGILSDASAVSTPAVSIPYSFTLSRSTNYIDPEEDFGLDPEEGLSPQASGSLRTLALLFDSVLSDTEKLQMSPVITIPKEEIGVLNPDAVNILRVSEKLVDGKIVKKHAFLPAHFDASGNLAAKDIYLPNELLEEETPPGAAKSGNPPVYISYVPLTFQGTINWVRQPKLVRMVPDAKADAKRKPITAFTEEEEEEKEWELKKPIKNVIVFVHGHNEAEKTGLAGQFERNAPFPWAVDYKRDVWKYMYEIFMKDYMEFNSCTVFYEFIYPTWRPVFGHLDDALVTLITGELEKQLSYNVEEKDSMAFNLFIVAHSMGGVVSRAGIMKFPEVLDDQFKHFASWGSPHRGAAMYSLRYQVTSPAYKAKTWTGSAVSSAVSAYVSRAIIDAPGIMDLRWTNGPDYARRHLKLDDYFEIKDAYTSQDNIYNLRTGSLIYNQRLEQLNQQDNRGGKYTFMYGITTQGIPASEIADMGVSELKNVLQQGEIPIGATINRFLVENGFNPLYGHIESDSDGAVPIASMTGLGLFPSALTDLGNIDHESYYHNPDNARFTARTTFEALGFGTNPLYDPPEIVFENPLEDEPLETAQNGDVIIEGKLDWKGPRKLDGSGVKDIQLFKYTYENEFENGFDWEGMEVEVGDASWSIDSEGNFSVFCNIPEAEKVYALRAVIVFRDDTEMHGAVMLGSPEEFELKAEGETVLWSVEGLERIFSVDGELYVYGQPKEGEMPAVGISASINPVFTGENKIHKIAVSKYNEGGGEPVEWDENEVIWPIGAEEPPLELAQMDVSLSTFYESRNAFSVYYIVSGYFDDNTVYRFMYVFLMPADRREASDLLPPHFRPQELPDEEE